MAEIAIDSVTKRYADGTEAVKDASIEIEDGEFIILVGPSGCGKSTLLRMIAGLEDISEGEVRIDGRRMNERAPKDRNIAMVFQNYALYPHMSVRENMAFPLKLAKMRSSEIDQRVAEAARILDLDGLLDRKPSQLSGGQRQRVAMGRAIVREPAAFLMDEPLSNLDAKLRVAMRTQISRLQRRLGVTTVYVTHDQVEAMTLGDRVAVMRKGVVQQVATPRELYERPVNIFVGGFIGSPAMNFLPGRVRDGVLSLPLGQVQLPDDVRQQIDNMEGRRLAVGIRPEHFADASLASDVGGEGARVKVHVDLVESLGAELFAYFSLDGQRAEDFAPDELREDSTDQLVARLDPASKATKGCDVELWLDGRKLLFFDSETGENLALVGAASPAPGSTASSQASPSISC